jgi:hypothetical protein
MIRAWKLGSRLGVVKKDTRGRLAINEARLLIEIMKTLFFHLALALTISSSFAEEFLAPAGAQREITTEAPELKPTIDGIVLQIFTDKPWQAVNPAAPASYGTGEKNVSKDIAGGTPYQASGLTVVGVEW